MLTSVAVPASVISTTLTGHPTSSRHSTCGKGGGEISVKIQPAGIRTKSGGARSIEGGKGPAGSGLSLGVAGVENGGRKDAAFPILFLGLIRAKLGRGGHGDLRYLGSDI